MQNVIYSYGYFSLSWSEKLKYTNSFRYKSLSVSLKDKLLERQTAFKCLTAN